MLEKQWVRGGGDGDKVVSITRGFCACGFCARVSLRSRMNSTRAEFTVGFSMLSKQAYDIKILGRRGAKRAHCQAKEQKRLKKADNTPADAWVVLLVVASVLAALFLVTKLALGL